MCTITSMFSATAARCASSRPAGKFRVFEQQTIRDGSEPDKQDFNAIQHPLQHVPTANLSFSWPVDIAGSIRFIVSLKYSAGVPKAGRA